MPADRRAAAGAADLDGALPVADRDVELLVGEQGADVEVEPLPRHADPPALRIAGAASRAPPFAAALDLEIGEGERPLISVRSDRRAAARRIGAALPAQAVEHE